MRGMGMQKLGWGWPATAFAVVIAVGAAALFLLVRPETGDLAGRAAATSLAVHVLVLVAAAFTYLHWRMSSSALTGWLTLGLVMLSTPHLALAGVLIADPAVADRGPWWPLVTKLAVVAVLFVLVLVASRLDALPTAPLPVDPLAAGLATGICFSALGLALVRWAPELVVPSALITALNIVPLLLSLAFASLAARGAQLSRWGSLRVSIGVGLVMVGQLAGHSALPVSVAETVNLVASTAGAVILGHFALAMIRATIRLNRRELASLYARLGATESTMRDSRARLHEVASTIAGISSVSRLIREPTVVLPRQRRSLLEDTMDAELGRLGRLTMGESDAVQSFPLDNVVRQLVVAQHAQGRTVSWEPSGSTVVGRPDDLTEALHILLDNAAKHGRSQGATVQVRERDGVVEILVSDRGPGISPEVRSRVFEWGVRGDGSRGQGIGLAIARDLVQQQGGYLMHDDSPQPGTTFIVGVPVGEKHDATSHRAG
jgi:signal transduction histidine kinase